MFKLFFGFLLIYLGIKVLIGGSCCKSNRGYQDEANTLFGESRVECTQKPTEYNVAFGKATYDMTSILQPGQSAKCKLNVLFGTASVKLSPDIPVEIVLHSAFASAITPDGSTIPFGTYVYRSPRFKAGEPALFVECNVVFGSVTFTQ